MNTVNQDVLKIIADHAQETREQRQVAEASVQALKECGFFRSLLPKSLGGLENTPQQFFADQIQIAEADMSTAWACGIIAVHAFQIALMDEQAQQDVYGDDPNTLVSSSYNPMGGKVQVTDNGLKLSGRWGWSSGSGHASWALLGAIVPGEGYRTFLIPRDQYRIEDTWFSMGLEGTGSNDVVIDEPIDVPDYRTHKQMDGFNCVQNQPNPMYKMPWAQTFIRVVCTPAIGALQHALTLFIDNANTSSTDPLKLAGDVETQTRIAQVANIIDECKAILFKNFDAIQANNWEMTIEQRVLYRYQAGLVIDKCRKGIDTLFEVGGGRSVFTGHPLQILWHDIHIARAHVANNPSGFARNLGSVMLGMDNTDVFL